VTDEEALARRVEQLERANEELRRANMELARERIGRSDSGGASALHRATAAERDLLRTQGWDDWPRPLRFLVQIAIKLRRWRMRFRS